MYTHEPITFTKATQEDEHRISEKKRRSERKFKHNELKNNPPNKQLCREGHKYS